MNKYDALVKTFDPLVISDGCGFEMQYETNVFDDDGNETGETKVSLQDSDGDGDLYLTFAPSHSGVDVKVRNLFGKTQVATFDKRELKEFLMLALAALENDKAE